MITIRIKQPVCDDYPDGWAEFEFTDRARAQEHWDFLSSARNQAEWLEDGKLLKTLGR